MSELEEFISDQASLGLLESAAVTKTNCLLFLRIFTSVCVKHNIVSRIIYTTLISKSNARTLGLSQDSLTPTGLFQSSTVAFWITLGFILSVHYRVLYSKINNKSNYTCAFCLCVLLRHIVYLAVNSDVSMRYSVCLNTCVHSMCVKYKQHYKRGIIAACCLEGSFVRMAKMWPLRH